MTGFGGKGLFLCICCLLAFCARMISNSSTKILCDFAVFCPCGGRGWVIVCACLLLAWHSSIIMLKTLGNSVVLRGGHLGHCFCSVNFALQI